jgi:hypothetical protein
MLVWAYRVRVLVEREARGALVPFVLLLVGAPAAAGALRLLPWTSDPGVAAIEYQVVSLLLVVAVAFAFTQRQAEDLTGGRDRHLFSFPITPVQVLAAKTLVTAAAGALTLAVLHATWLVLWNSAGGLPGGVPLSTVVASQWLALMPIWANLLLIKRIKNAVTVLFFLVLLWLNVPPVSLGGLLLPMEAEAGSLPLAGLTAVFALLLTLAVLERHLTLRTVA